MKGFWTWMKWYSKHPHTFLNAIMSFFFCLGPKKNRVTQKGLLGWDLGSNVRLFSWVTLVDLTEKDLPVAEVKKNERKIERKPPSGSGSNLAEGSGTVTKQKEGASLVRMLHGVRAEDQLALARLPPKRSVVPHGRRLIWSPHVNCKKPMQKHLCIRILHKKMARSNRRGARRPSGLRVNSE